MHRALRDAFEVLGSRKDFGGRFIGDPRLNRLGLHPTRIVGSEACVAARRAQLRALGLPRLPEAFRRDGVLVMPDFLPAPLFEAVRSEATARMEALAAVQPRPTSTKGGFGPRMPFPGGFDRFDGPTLNRFGEIDLRTTPRCAEAARAPRLARLATMASGFRYRPQRLWIYETTHGDERVAADIQKVLHRDTFHSTIKLWLFLEDVRVEDGPFVYVPGSHRVTAARLRWEQTQALRRTKPGVRDRGGAFRIDEGDLATMSLPAAQPYPVAGNTLVLADTRGFHRRGDAAPGATRLALHASLRSWPFSPFAY